MEGTTDQPSGDGSGTRALVVRGTQLGLAVALSVALVGYFVGLAGNRQSARGVRLAPPTHVATVADEAAIPATAYAQMRAERTGPNRAWANNLAALAQRTPDIEAAVNAQVSLDLDPRALDAAKHAALDARAARRAYNGAPPVIPHRIDQESAESCIACHKSGLQVGDRRAARVPHALLLNCIQCHVEQAGSMPLGANGLDVVPLTIVNEFVGLPAPMRGERAWIGAPPTIPHSTLMRTDCLACHGAGGALGMRSTHPWRASCLQCHGPSSALDQVPAGTASAP